MHAWPLLCIRGAPRPALHAASRIKGLLAGRDAAAEGEEEGEDDGASAATRCVLRLHARTHGDGVGSQQRRRPSRGAVQQ